MPHRGCWLGEGHSGGRETLWQLEPSSTGTSSGHSEHPHPGEGSRGRTGGKEIPLLDWRWNRSESL